MKFEEDAIKLDNIANSQIYFLLKNKEVVYIGQTRTNQYKNDILYDEIYVINCSVDECDYLHDKYLKKYKPNYNTHMNYAINYSLARARNKIREKYNNPSFTIKGLRALIKILEIELYLCDQQVCMNIDDYKKITDYIDYKLGKGETNE